MVHSLQPEYKDQIQFVIARLDTQEGRWFAQYHEVGKVTLLFFSPDGTKITSLNGVQTPEYLRRVFQKVFKL